MSNDLRVNCAVTKRGGFSDQQAMVAIKLIAPNLLSACVEPDQVQPESMQAKEAVMLGATLAGMAFSNASVGLVHGMSRPLGVHFHIPHGMSNAMLLSTVTAYSLPGDPKRYAQCAQLMGLVDSIEDTAFAHKALLNELERLNRALCVPNLAEFGVKQSQFIALIPEMAKQALASGSPSNNPLIPEPADIERLYAQLWP